MDKPLATNAPPYEYDLLESQAQRFRYYSRSQFSLKSQARMIDTVPQKLCDGIWQSIQNDTLVEKRDGYFAITA
jgi:hypothetical protein